MNLWNPAQFEEKLAKQKIMSKDEMQKVCDKASEECTEALKQVRDEPFPEPTSIYDHVYAEVDGDKGRDTLAQSIGIDYSLNPPQAAHH